MRYFFLWVFLCSVLVADGQTDKSVIIYTDDTPYLMPFIENEIAALKLAETDKSVFEKVTNLARLLENLQAEQRTDDVRLLLSDEDMLSFRPRTDEDRKELLRLFESYDYFIKININPLVELIEYQFTLYEIIKPEVGVAQDSTVFNRMIFDLGNPLKSVSRFIDPRAVDHQRALALSIRSLLPATNHPPQCEFRTNAAISKDSKLSSISVTDTLIIDATDSYDVDNDFSELAFIWKQTSANGEEIPTAEKVGLRRGTSVQKITFAEPGMYYFQLTVKDNISSSTTQTITIQVIDKPLIYIPVKKYTVYDFAHNQSLGYKYPIKLKLRGLTYSPRNFRFSIIRKTPTKLDDSNSEIVEVLSKARSTYSDSIKQYFTYPEVLTFDTSHQAGELFTINLHTRLDPFDAPNGSDYEFLVGANFYGVPSNTSTLSISYVPIKTMLSFNAKFLFDNDNRIPFDSTAFELDLLRPPVRFAEARDYNSVWFSKEWQTTVGYTSFGTSLLSIDINFGLNRFEIGEVKTEVFSNLPDFTATDSLVLYKELGWYRPRLFPGFKIAYRPYRRPYQGQDNGLFFKLYLDVSFLVRDYRNVTYYISENSSNEEALQERGSTLIAEQNGSPSSYLTTLLGAGIDVHAPFFGKKNFAQIGLGATRFSQHYFFNIEFSVSRVFP